MGHNDDLSPKATAGAGVVWLRTDAMKATTVLEARRTEAGKTNGGDHSAAEPSMTVEAMDPVTLEIINGSSHSCVTKAVAGGWSIACALG